MNTSLFAKIKNWFVSLFCEQLIDDATSFKATVDNVVVPVTEEEAYIPYRSNILSEYLKSKQIDLSKFNDEIAWADASVKAKRLRASNKTPTNIDIKSNATLKFDTGVVVLKLTDLKVSRCTLTLSSSVPNTIVIINVSRGFSLSNGKIQFAGGINSENVLINYCGAGTPSLTGLSNLAGTILTNKRVLLSGKTTFEGETIYVKPNLAGDAVYKNKTNDNMARLQAEREAAASQVRR